MREEYLIYDTVALISAIGGTLGIFIGFSFGGMSGQILKFISEIVASQERRVNVAGESRDPESTCEITTLSNERISKMSIDNNKLK